MRMTRLWLLQLVLYFLGFKVILKQKRNYIDFEFVCIKKCDIWIEVLELKNKNDKIVSLGWHVVFFITTLSQKIFCLTWYQFDDSYIRHIGCDLQYVKHQYNVFMLTYEMYDPSWFQFAMCIKYILSISY
jgi:hypothetical protein